MENGKNYPLYSLPEIRNLDELLSSKAEQIPESTAIQFTADRELISKTYKDLYNDVNGLKNYFLKQGYVRKHIAIISENSYFWIVAFLAITNSGNVAVQIDKGLSGDDISDLLKESDCEYVFASDKVKEKLNGTITVFELEKTEQLISEGNADGYHSVELDTDELAAIFFTSGTTGKNKGVMLSHKNMASDINFSCKNFKLDGNTLSILPYHHTFGLITAIFMVLNYGKSIYINQNMRYIQRELQIVKPQMVFMVPLFVESFCKMIIQAEKKGVSAVEMMGGNLEYIICGGAFLNQKYIDFYKERGILILNGYGITECSPVVAVNRNHFQKDGSIGQILQGCDVSISTDEEILIKGDNVMLGYYNDEKANEEAFQNGYFCTGDLGYKDEDSFLFITGRKKNLIILSNGENVSPERIERMILSDKAVSDALIYDENGIITSEILPVDLNTDKKYFDTLINQINDQLPAYMRVGKCIIRSSDFERNSNGKIIRNQHHFHE